MNIQTIVKSQLRKNIPEIKPGQVVRVHEKVQEGKGKERTQIFEGLVIAAKHGKGLNATFTVRKIGAANVGVERTFPLHMPSIQKIEVLRQEKIRRSKLYYVRGQVGQKTKKRKTSLQNRVFEFEEVDEEVKEEEEKDDSSQKQAGEKEKNSKDEEKNDKKEEDKEAKKEEEEGTNDSKEGVKKEEDSETAKKEGDK